MIVCLEYFNIVHLLTKSLCPILANLIRVGLWADSVDLAGGSCKYDSR